MQFLELYCLAVVVFYVIATARGSGDKRAFFVQMGALVGAAWLTENTAIRFYGFYVYSPKWHLFIDQVPLLIVLIWPVVIHSASRLLGSSATARPLLVAALVFTDAWLIEPIAVWAKLWHWTHPGLFGVPPIGVLGWALFTYFALRILRNPSLQSPWRRAVVTIVLAPTLTHLALVACWWIVFRWVEGTVPAHVGVMVGFTVSLASVAAIVRWKLNQRIVRAALWLRLPGALFFFTLLVIYPEPQAMLIVYATAFALPYLFLLAPTRAQMH